jgi:hypothetical protein
LKTALERTAINQSDAAVQTANQIALLRQTANQNAIERERTSENERECYLNERANQNERERERNERANQNANDCQNERRAMSECGDTREPVRQRLTSNSEKTAHAFVSIRAPEAFKAGQDTRAWPKRLEQYFSAANVTDSVSQANTLANALSNYVHAALFKLKLSQETCNDPKALKTILIR